MRPPANAAMAEVRRQREARGWHGEGYPRLRRAMASCVERSGFFFVGGGFGVVLVVLWGGRTHDGCGYKGRGAVERRGLLWGQLVFVSRWVGID